jgi:hypothetical protein
MELPRPLALPTGAENEAKTMINENMLRGSLDHIARLTKERDALIHVLNRCKMILSNMALENEGSFFNRWPIHHEPLRSDAKHLLPLIDATLDAVPEPDEILPSSSASALADRSGKSVGLIEAADMAEKEAPGWPINNGTLALQQFARKLRACAAAKSTPTWTGNGPMPDDVQGWPDRSASTDEADEDKPLGFRTNDVPDPYAEGPQSNAEPEYYSYPDMDGITTRNVIPAQSDAEPVQAFAKAVLHGDDEHKAWLLEAAGAFIAGNPLPAPRGKGAAPPPKPKPVYCLGWNTINYVREHGTLETENVAFIAASDLLHDPRPDASAGLIEAAELAEKYVNGMDRLRADTITGKSLKEFANILRARAADRSGK